MDDGTGLCFYNQTQFNSVILSNTNSMILSALKEQISS